MNWLSLELTLAAALLASFFYYGEKIDFDQPEEKATTHKYSGILSDYHQKVLNSYRN